jgi:acetyl-CoA carboxylase biotin carboxyl carrier protein
VSRLTPLDIESLIQQFEASDWATLELTYGESRLFLSKRPDQLPSWGAAGDVGQLTTSAPEPESPPGVDTESATENAEDPLPDAGAPREQPTPAELAPGHVFIRAPSLGTFYRAPKPGAEPYTQIGQTVRPDSELCLIEVMKLFTTLYAGVNGKVQAILASDGELIEHGQPLFVIDTHG